MYQSFSQYNKNKNRKLAFLLFLTPQELLNMILYFLVFVLDKLTGVAVINPGILFVADYFV